jgi:Fur family transcriptional regulator, ferric uptake regulator
VNPYQERIRERFYRALLEQNLKLTKPRKALIDVVLRKRGWHFQAEDLMRELNERAPGVVSRATIYRTLDLLVHAGILAKTRIHENSYRYELADTESHHHHLVDMNTGKVVEFQGDKELHRMLKRVCDEHGFTEHYHVFEVFGEFSKPASKRSVRASKPPATAPGE